MQYIFKEPVYEMKSYSQYWFFFFLEDFYNIIITIQSLFNQMVNINDSIGMFIKGLLIFDLFLLLVNVELNIIFGRQLQVNLFKICHFCISTQNM